MITESFNTNEMYALASIMLLDCKSTKRIYKTTGIDGMAVVTLSNVMFINNDNIAANCKDLHVMARMYDDLKGDEIVRQLYTGKIYTRHGHYYFSTPQLNIIRCNNNVKAAITRCREMQYSRCIKYPANRLYNQRSIKKAFSRLLESVNADLPDYIAERLATLPATLHTINTERCFRILNLFISLDESAMATKEFLGIQQRIANKKADDIMKFIQETGIWKYDGQNKIIYDPVLRQRRGLPATPTATEILTVYDRRKNIIPNYFKKH